MEELRYKPVAFFRCDDTTPLQDYSGFNRAGYVEGTEAHGISLTPDSVYSQRFNNNTYGKFFAPVYQPGQELEDFTLAMTFYPIVIGAGSHQQLMTHGGVFDGFTVEGTTLHFTTMYPGLGMARCSYNFETSRKMNIVGIHQPTKNSLFVDGVLVAEVDISPEQQSVDFASSEPAFYSVGSTDNNQRCLVNNVAIYNRALHPEEILAIHNYNSRVVEADVPLSFGGDTINLDSGVRGPTINEVWDDSTSFLSGSLTESSVDGEAVYGTRNSDTGLTRGGTWEHAVDLYYADTPVLLKSANLWWEGKNVSVSVSVDSGATWVAAVKGKNLSVIPENFNPTNKVLLVRVTFTAGVDEAYLTSIKFHAYTSNTGTVNNRVITWQAAVTPLEPFSPSRLDDRGGINLNGAQLTIGIDNISEVKDTVRSVEIWIKKTSATNPTFSANLTAVNNYYYNGSSNTSYEQGEWVVRHFVVTSGSIGPVTISGDAIIGRVAFYTTVLSAADVATIVSNYTGVNKTRQDASAIITMTEPAASTVIYAHDWEKSAA